VSLLGSGFEEGLVRTAATSIDEDEVLSCEVRAYREEAAGDDFRTLEGFLADHRRSGRRVALLTNLDLSSTITSTSQRRSMRSRRAGR
jgi:hypothetical protein